jgi:Zn-dependent peptidase ImmA (M78 family)/transcriptional regulator with XRE-family HTH domain
MFNPNRLDLARKRRRLTKKALASVAEVSPVTLSRWGADKNEPDSEVIARVANALRYPVAFFYGEDLEDPHPDTVSFRSMSKMAAKERDAALTAGTIAFYLDDWVQSRFNLPGVDLPSMGFEPEPESAAYMLRQHWGIGQQPIGNIIKLMETKGIRVFSLSENTRNVDAFSCWRNGTPYVFLNTYKSTEHSRFDAAHEIGHLVLHQHGQPAHSRDAEKEANDFAASFLMPSADIEAHVSHVFKLEHIVKAKKRWGVSVAALAYRLNRIGRISDWHYRDFCIQINRLGYRIKEPNGLPREQSAVWSKVLASLWADRITKNNIADDLALPLEELEGVLFGLVGIPDDLPKTEIRPSILKLVD